MDEENPSKDGFPISNSGVEVIQNFQSKITCQIL